MGCSEESDRATTKQHKVDLCEGLKGTFFKGSMWLKRLKVRLRSKSPRAKKS